MRTTFGVLAVLGSQLGFSIRVPDWTTGRGWSDQMDVIGWAEECVRRDGLYIGAETDMDETLPVVAADSPAGRARAEMLRHVREHMSGLCVGERLPGSTEVLESVFGKYKQLEGEQSRGGLTSLLLSLGTLVGQTTTTMIQQAMESCPLKCVLRWCKDKLGKTVQSQRREASAM